MINQMKAVFSSTDALNRSAWRKRRDQITDGSSRGRPCNGKSEPSQPQLSANAPSQGKKAGARIQKVQIVTILNIYG